MLDSTAARDLVAHLCELARSGTAVIVCEHRVAPLRSAGELRILSLDGGRPDPSASRGLSAPFPAAQSSSFALRVAGLDVQLGARQVLRGVSFAAHSGEVLAVVGPNGAGKTTLLRAMAGLVRYSGTIAVDGEQPDLSLVYQNPDLQLFNPTVRDEVLYKVRDPDMDRYHWLVRALGLVPYENTPPLLLSEGEKKRLALAVVLMRAPRHGVLLDEPALGQDSAHKAKLIELARALARSGRVVIMTTHDLTLAAQADRMLLLGRGEIAADASPALALADDAAWARIGLAVPGWVREAA
jgi:energy-coupling factor transporter ATP-binding protein EcfA2